jgi:hypothetical protein
MGVMHMEEVMRYELEPEWIRRWRVARAAVATASTWILALPLLARMMNWHRRTVTWVQNIVGPVSGLIWGRIGWVGVRHYGFSKEDAFLAGGLAGIVAPTVELTLRLLGWPPGRHRMRDVSTERPPLLAYPLAWFWGFLFGGAVASVGAALARLGQKR